MFNPAIASEHIKNEFIDYILTTKQFADEALRQSFEYVLRNIICKGPILDIKDVFEPSLNIIDLIGEGLLSPLFYELESKKPKPDPNDKEKKYKRKLPLDRSLYTHQVEAARIITLGKNAVVTTGTGSGKTETFLIPILNSLLREKEAGSLSREGIRAILIYPMNALANDQMKRLREILMYFNEISFAIYTGDTKHSNTDAKIQYTEMHRFEKYDELSKPLINERISRDDIKSRPPHILCTNYAMLEHMLLRPDDDTLFASADLRFIVLDEAHVYAGATGMETALLLRRLKARIRTSIKTQFILTSATLGNKDESEEYIIKFAKNLCGEEFEYESIIFGKRREWIPQDDLKNTPISIFDELALHDHRPDSKTMSRIFNKYGLVYEDDVSCEENLYNMCVSSVLYANLRQVLDGPQSIDWFSSNLGVPRDSFISFIHICSQARKNECSLIDARYHFFVRALEGAYVALTDKKKIFLERKSLFYENDICFMVFEIAVCDRCGRIALTGEIKDNHLIPVQRYSENERYFTLVNDDFTEIELNDDVSDELEENDFDGVSDENENEKDTSVIRYSMCISCGDIIELNYDEDVDAVSCGCAKIKRVLILERKNSNGRCVQCNVGKYRSFYLGNEAATAVLATSLFELLPKKNRIIVKENEEVSLNNAGKQFLSFSDSRSEAAYFASYMKQSYHEFLRRRGIVKSIEKLDNGQPIDDYYTNDIVNDLKDLFLYNETFENKIGGEFKSSHEKRKISERHSWMAVLKELINAQRSESLTSLGYLQFRYIGNTNKIVNHFASEYFCGKIELCKTVLDELVMIIARSGALLCPDVFEPEDKKYVFYTEKQIGFVEKSIKRNNVKKVWLPRNKVGKSNEWIKNKKHTLVTRALRYCGAHNPEIKAYELLEKYWEILTDKRRNEYALKLYGSVYVLDPSYFRVVLPDDTSAIWYQCQKCNRVTTYSVDNRCNIDRCDGKIIKINIKILYSNNHYKRLYSSDWLRSLQIREHTAQLSRKTALEFQQMFEKNEIHALSCSTTFEMGVDVGELETVFLRNIPPSASNYTQRAGRAGRSENAAAYALTYARPCLKNKCCKKTKHHR